MNHTQSKDPFEQFVKNKLTNYETDVPSDTWGRLEGSLASINKPTTLRRKRIFSTAIAVAAIFLGVLFVHHSLNKNEQTLIEQTFTEKNLPINKVLDKEKKDKITPEPDKSSTKFFADNLSHNGKKEKNKSKDFQKEENIIVTYAEEYKQELVLNIDEGVSKPQSDKKQPKEIDEKTKQQMIQDFISEGQRGIEVENGETTSKKRIKKMKSIALTGQSGLLASQYSNNTPSTLRSSIQESYAVFSLSKMGDMNEEREIKPESEVTHSQPLSFGLLASFPLSSRLQLETGVVYTYLSSEITNKSDSYNETEKIQFHYLGIPLNLNYTLLKINKLDMYISAGAMIEKDVYGRTKYTDEKKIFSSNSIYTNNKLSKINQKNPQLSISSGLGFSYPIYNQTKLFGKVGAKYYLNADNEYKTYYNDEKIGLDIQLGIKFDF